MPPKSNPASKFRRRLAAWFRRHGRDLPWRRTRDPYRIVVSEVMLQQTQVSRVLDYYPAFLKRYPDLGRLARARPAQVREAWDGLGYYRRAENLRRMAGVVAREHGGRLPREVPALRRLPGIGPYTAGAVACFAFEQATPAIDTNVARVLTRVFNKTGRRLRRIAESLQPRAGPAAWTFNQALMELGALVCTARKPRCGSCPVRRDCAFYQRTGFKAPK